MRQLALSLLLTLLLGAIVALYGARIWQEFTSDPLANEPAQIASTPEGSRVDALAPATFVPEKVDMERILDKAVFEPTREPPRPEPIPEPEPEPEAAPEPEVESGPKPLQITILGIVLQDGSGVVLYQPKQGGVPKQLTLGETVDGWKLIELVGVHAVFEQDGEEVRLQLLLE